MKRLQKNIKPNSSSRNHFTDKAEPDFQKRIASKSKIDKYLEVFCPSEITDPNDRENIYKDKIEKLIKENHKLSNKLNKFFSNRELINNEADIYVDLVRISNKRPTLNTLDLASWGRSSVSTWGKKLQKTALLDTIIDKLSDLKNRTKKNARIEFYEGVIKYLHDSYIKLLAKKAKQEHRDKRITDNEGNEIELGQHISDKNQFDEFNHEKDNEDFDRSLEDFEI